MGSPPPRAALWALALAPALALVSAPARASAPDAPGDDGAYDPFLAFGPEPGTGAATEAPPAYRDRIIDPTRLEALPPDEDDTSSGPARSLHVELLANGARFAGESSLELGAAFGGFWDTADHGAISVDALVFRSDLDREDDARWRGLATVWQRALPMPGGWSVDNGIGVLNTSLPGILRDQYRFILPTVPVLGASSEWTHAGNAQQWQASAGRGGVYRGARLSGFEGSDSAVASAGGQWRWSANASGAVSVLATDGRIVPDDQGLPEFQNGETRAVLTGHRWQGRSQALQFNVLASDTEAAGAVGAWLDGRADRGSLTHRYGLFNLQPDLAWGAWPINNDVRGGYYRLDYSRARWSWNTSIDRIRSISGDGFDGWYGNAFLRYQASSRLGYGGGLTWLDGSGGDGIGSDAQALQLYVDLQSDLGQTRLQYDQAHDSRDDGSWQFTADHALRLREGSRLSLSASVGELAGDQGVRDQVASVAAYGGFDVTDDFSIDGTVRYSHAESAGAGGLDLNLGWRWRLAPRWTLLGNLSENRAVDRSPFVLDPITNQPLFEKLPDDRSLYLSLRYEYGAGGPRPVLGGSASAATGRIVGSVFLDDNGDGVRSASEQPAANVTVQLDGRYSVRTDAQGRYRFERVAVGPREVRVVPDNLPLPWSIDEAATRHRVDVEVRRDVVLDIGATRPR